MHSRFTEESTFWSYLNTHLIRFTLSSGVKGFFWDEIQLSGPSHLYFLKLSQNMEKTQHCSYFTRFLPHNLSQ